MGLDINSTERDFLHHSNLIEKEPGMVAFVDATDAWVFMRDNPLTLENLLETHKILMQRLNPSIAGKIRKYNVSVGRYSCPRPRILNQLLEEWFETYEAPEAWGDIKKAHIDFEMIHPFGDGNGRIGRMIMNKHLYDAGKELKVIYYEERNKYYNWFHQTKEELAQIAYLQSIGEDYLAYVFATTQIYDE